MTNKGKAAPGANRAASDSNDHADSVAKRSKHREMLPVKPLSKYRAKQLRAIEPGTLGAALLAALESRVAA